MLSEVYKLARVWYTLTVVMGRKKRKPVSSAVKSAPCQASTAPEPLSRWELAKSRGNSMYGQNEYEEALEQYIIAIGLLELETSDKGLCISW